jgi:hypothetical protein
MWQQQNFSQGVASSGLNCFATHSIVQHWIVYYEIK